MEPGRRCSRRVDNRSQSEADKGRPENHRRLAGQAGVHHRRSKVQIDAARKAKLSDLPDPEADEKRVQKPEWLIVVGVCTHLGCIPLGQKKGQPLGDHGGWFCPCHGSHYDTSGRIRKGPAPRNLPIPKYKFLTDASVLIG